jgi:hypothetical protein
MHLHFVTSLAFSAMASPTLLVGSTWSDRPTSHRSRRGLRPPVKPRGHKCKATHPLLPNGQTFTRLRPGAVLAGRRRPRSRPPSTRGRAEGEAATNGFRELQTLANTGRDRQLSRARDPMRSCRGPISSHDTISGPPTRILGTLGLGRQLVKPTRVEVGRGKGLRGFAELQRRSANGALPLSLGCCGVAVGHRERGYPRPGAAAPCPAACRPS